MLECISTRGMNPSETDAEDSPSRGQQRHVATLSFWMSDEIAALLRELDSIQETLQTACLTRKKRGNRPIPIVHCDHPRTKFDSPATPKLPRNWYREQWLSGLKKIELIRLDAQEPKLLPSLVSVDNDSRASN